MMLPVMRFEVKLIELPKIQNEKTKEWSILKNFTVKKKYRVYSVFDSGAGFTDFLVADDEGVFRWINTSLFRA
ncbi:hypothetical protein ES707_18987 [subsurface metagenome]